MFYKVTALLENPNCNTEHVTYEKEVVFNYDEEQYGNGTYMWFGDNYYDLRYNTDYKADRQVQFINDFCVHRWDGTRGAWNLIGLTIEWRLSDEKEQL